jgi:hypothetical protein
LTEPDHGSDPAGMLSNFKDAGDIVMPELVQNVDQQCTIFPGSSSVGKRSNRVK